MTTCDFCANFYLLQKEASLMRVEGQDDLCTDLYIYHIKV